MTLLFQKAGGDFQVYQITSAKRILKCLCAEIAAVERLSDEAHSFLSQQCELDGLQKIGSFDWFRQVGFDS